MNKQLIADRIELGLVVLWGLVFFLFPLLYTTFTTEGFIFPKTTIVAIAVLVTLLAWGAQILITGQVRLRRTPLDVPVILFAVAVILSSLFSGNRADSLVGAGMVVFAVLSYFALVNVFRTRKVAMMLLSSLTTGTVLAALIMILSHYRIYVLPFVSAKTPSFTPLGSYLEFALVAAIVFPLTLPYIITPAMKRHLNARLGVFVLAAAALAAGVVVAFMGLLTTQKPIILPFDIGFQTAFAAISQDSGRILQTFLFGEGYQTFASVFARFHNGAINSNQQLWFLSFANSSSYILELLATTGLAGTLSYLYLAYKALTPIAKKKKNPFYLSCLVALVLSVLLPFSMLEVILLFFLFAGLTIAQRETAPHEYFDIELKFVALKKGVVSFTTLDSGEQTRADRHPTPFVAFAILLALVVVLGYYGTTYAYSDVLFQQSLAAANTNNGTRTYALQAQAITTYPYRSDYYRIFSQTNIALANSLLSLNSGNNSSPSATTQQTAYQLIQQAITTARQATTLAPQSALAWQNLSSVYRSLIGVGQNADQFAVSAGQQATTLDSANPQEYVNLGGIYYQMGQYDNAIRMFQQAIALKNDYANAYYNLAHAYEQKGDVQDLQNALSQLQIVKQLVASNPTNADQVSKEIAALQAKIGSGSQSTQAAPTTQSSASQQPLAIPTSSQLPAQPTQVPLVSPTPTK